MNSRAQYAAILIEQHTSRAFGSSLAKREQRRGRQGIGLRGACPLGGIRQPAAFFTKRLGDGLDCGCSTVAMHFDAVVSHEADDEIFLAAA